MSRVVLKGIQMTAISRAIQSSLYEEDYYLWLERTVEIIKNRDAKHLDWQHLGEEIDALGNEQKRAVESYLKQLLIHLLLYAYWQAQKNYCQRGWKLEITNFRDELEFYLRSKTLYNYCRNRLDDIYLKARRQAIQKTDLNPDIFPLNCPFNITEILDTDYFPE
jgi:hypothetical protein